MVVFTKIQLEEGRRSCHEMIQSERIEGGEGGGDGSNMEVHQRLPEMRLAELKG